MPDSKVDVITNLVPLEDYTTTKVQGDGVMDKIILALRNQLAEELKGGRIDGIEYGQVISSLLATGAETALRFLELQYKLGLEAKNLELQGELIKQQIEAAKSDDEYKKALTKKVIYETENILPAQKDSILAQNALTIAQTENAVLERELTQERILEIKSRVLTEEANRALIVANTSRVTAELAKIPAEIALLEKQLTKITSENELIAAQIERSKLELEKLPHEINILKKQLDKSIADINLTEANTERVKEETARKLPAEIANLEKQGQAIDSNIALTDAKIEEMRAMIDKELPQRIALMQAQVAEIIKRNELASKELELKTVQIELQQRQVALAEAELDVKRAELDVAKAQIEIALMQAELYKQKTITEQAQTDGSVIKKDSVIYWNNKTLEGQVKAYDRDHLQKMSKLWIDVFIVGANNEVRVANSTNKLDDPTLGIITNKLLATLNDTIV